MHQCVHQFLASGANWSCKNTSKIYAQFACKSGLKTAPNQPTAVLTSNHCTTRHPTSLPMRLTVERSPNCHPQSYLDKAANQLQAWSNLKLQRWRNFGWSTSTKRSRKLQQWRNCGWSTSTKRSRKCVVPIQLNGEDLHWRVDCKRERVREDRRGEVPPMHRALFTSIEISHESWLSYLSYTLAC